MWPYQRRVARNEHIFRTHNEAISDAVGRFVGVPDDNTLGFMCECAITECVEIVELSMAKYQVGRSDPAWFVVKPEHLISGVEHLVQDHGTYWIIAKDGLGREVAEALASDVQ